MGKNLVIALILILCFRALYIFGQEMEKYDGVDLSEKKVVYVAIHHDRGE